MHYCYIQEIAKLLNVKLLSDFSKSQQRELHYNRKSATNNKKDLIVYRIEKKVLVFSRMDCYDANNPIYYPEYYSIYKLDLETLKPRSDSFYQRELPKSLIEKIQHKK